MLLLLACVFVFCLLYLVLSFHVVPDNTCEIVERCYKFQRVLEPGYHFLVPFLESIKRIQWNWRIEAADKSAIWKSASFTSIRKGEASYDFPPIEAETLDRLPVIVNGLLYYTVTDPLKMAYAVDSARSLSRWIEGALRHAIAQENYQTIVSKSDVLQTTIFKVYEEDKNVGKWGLTVTQLVIQSVDLPPMVKQNLMHLTREKNILLAKRETMEMETKCKEFEQKAKMEAESRQQAHELKRKELEQKATIDAEVIQQAHELALKKNLVAVECEIFALKLKSGMTPEYLLRNRELHMLEQQKSKVIVPHNFVSLSRYES